MLETFVNFPVVWRDFHFFSISDEVTDDVCTQQWMKHGTNILLYTHAKYVSEPHIMEGYPKVGLYQWTCINSMDTLHEVKTCIFNIASVWSCVQSNRKFNCTTHIYFMGSSLLLQMVKFVFMRIATNLILYMHVSHWSQTPKSVMTNGVFFLKSLLMELQCCSCNFSSWQSFEHASPSFIPDARAILYGHQSHPCPIVTFIHSFTIRCSQWTRVGSYATTTCIYYFSVWSV